MAFYSMSVTLPRARNRKTVPMGRIRVSVPKMLLIVFFSLFFFFFHYYHYYYYFDFEVLYDIKEEAPPCKHSFTFIHGNATLDLQLPRLSTVTHHFDTSKIQSSADRNTR